MMYDEDKAKELDEQQKIIDELYACDGLTDEVLDMQVALNELRHKLNIPDLRNKINGDFVQ